MLYLSGLYALNLPCSLKTCGDWHTSALHWENIQLKNSASTAFGDYGIEKHKTIPDHSDLFNVANHIRAILDLLAEKKFSVISNFNNDFICNDEYTEEIFQKVATLLPDDEINNFMHKTYGRKWRKWIGEQNMGK